MKPFARIAAVVLVLWSGATLATYKSIVVVSGSSQVVGLGEPLAPIVLRVLDEAGNPYQGMRIAFPPACKFFDQPGSRPCMYAAEGENLERVSDANGVVQAPRYVANGVKGNASMYIYSVGEPVLLQASVHIRIVEWGSHDPFAIQVVSGERQQVPLGTTMTQPIVVRVVDQGGLPVAGVSVKFVPDCHWLTFGTPEPCTIGNDLPVYVTSDAFGLARSPLYTANHIPGENPILAFFSQDGGDGVGIVIYNVVRRTAATSGELALQIEDGGTCNLHSFEALPAARVPSPKMVAFPHGFARIKLSGCESSTPVSIALHHGSGLPEGARVWAATPEWLPLDTSHPAPGISRFSLSDGGAGDAGGPGDGFIEAVVGVGFGDAHAPNFQDLWWAGPAENGWGLSIVQHGEMLLPTLFAYDASGQPTWYAMPAGSWNEGRDVFGGALYSPRGKPMGAHEASDLEVGSPVGYLRIEFDDALKATIVVEFGNSITRRQLTRQLFGPMDGRAVGRHADMWWAGPSQSGWGLVLQQQYSTLFGLLFTYRDDGTPTWLAMPSGYWSAEDTWEGRVLRSAGSSWPAYDASRLASEEVGGFRLKFLDGQATFDFMASGVLRRFELGRLPF